MGRHAAAVSGLLAQSVEVPRMIDGPVHLTHAGRNGQSVPHDLEAEQAVLGAILINAPSIAPVAELLRPEDFFRENHRRIFQAMLALHARQVPIDNILLADELTSRGWLGEVGGDTYLASLIAQTPTFTHVGHYAQVVHRDAVRRRLLRMSGRLAHAAYEQTDPVAALQEAERALSDLRASAGIVSSQLDSSLKELRRDESNLAAHTLSFVPITSAIEHAPTQPDWLWMGYSAKGAVTGIVARPKDGKTTLEFGLFRAWASGTTLLGLPTRQARAVLLSEERAPTLREQVDRWDVGDHVHVLLRHQAQGVPWKDIIFQATQHALSIKADALVVDTFAPWAGLSGDAENSAGAVLEAAEPLQWAASKGLAVLVSIHRRKSGGEYGESIRGSSALAGALDIIVELERPKNDVSQSSSTRVLRAVSRFEDTPAELVIRLTEQGYDVCGELPLARAKDEETRILAALQHRNRRTGEELAKELNLPKATTLKRLGHLLAEDCVVRHGEGKRNDPYVWEATRFDSSQVNPYRDETNRDEMNGTTVLSEVCSLCPEPVDQFGPDGDPYCEVHYRQNNVRGAK